jgi:potassium efflux system protein
MLLAPLEIRSTPRPLRSAFLRVGGRPRRVGLANRRGAVVFLLSIYAASLILFAPTHLYAQTESSTPEPAAAATEAAETAWIAVPQIPKETEALLQRLRRFEQFAAADPDITRYVEDTPVIARNAAQRQAETISTLAAVPSFGQLRDLEAEWSAKVARLSRRTAILSERATLLEGEIERLGTDRKVWRRTLENAIATESPDDVVSAVQSNLASIDRAGGALRSRRAIVLSILTATGDQELLALEMLQAVEVTADSLRTRLLVPDSPPIWKIFSSKNSDFTVADLSAAWNADWQRFEGFLKRRGITFPPLFVLFVFYFALTDAARRHLHRRAQSDHLEGAAGVFDRPLSVALVAMAVTGRAALPYAPGILYNLVGTAVLIPVLRVLTPIIPTLARPLLSAVAVFYIIDRIRDFLLTAASFERLILFLETGAAAVLLLLLIRRRRTRGVQHGVEVPASAETIVSLAMLALFASVLANGLGYLALGRLLGEGVLGSAYRVVLTYAAYRILLTLSLLTLSSETVRRVGAIRRHSEGLLRGTRTGLVLAAIVFWFSGALDAFYARAVVLAPLVAFVTTPVEIGTISISLSNIAAFPLTLALAWLVSTSVRALLEEDVYPRVTLQRGVGNAVTSMVHYTLLLGGFLLALGAAGIDFSRFSLLAGAFGVGVGFGLQNIVNNFVSGLILLFERPIQIGDMVELGNLMGEVKKIGIRASTIVTFQGAEVIVPNGTLLSDQLTNWTLSTRQRRIELLVGVAYGNDPNRVIEVLGEVLANNANVLRFPEPAVLFRGFGDSSLDFELRLWIDNFSVFSRVRSDVACEVHAALAAAGIEIPFPQRDLHLKSVDPAVSNALQGRPGVE